MNKFFDRLWSIGSNLMCAGAGNAHHACIANDGAEDSGCLRRGGVGYIDWRGKWHRTPCSRPRPLRQER
mgnify:CR=1 FL=1